MRVVLQSNYITLHLSNHAALAGLTDFFSLALTAGFFSLLANTVAATGAGAGAAAGNCAAACACCAC